MPELILASASPRRSVLLKTAGYEFTVVPSGAEEIKTGSPEYMVVQNAYLKAFDIASRPEYRGCAVIGADTVVSVDGRTLGKPADEEEAKAMLKMLSGNSHAVFTGYCVIGPGEDGETVRGFSRTEVIFRELADDEIDDYVASGEPMDKAGAYGVQERGCTLVERIDGDFFTVVGLPIAQIHKILREMGIKPSDILGQN